MAQQPALTGRKKKRYVLRYDLGRTGTLLETRIDATLEDSDGGIVGTPISPLYELRLTPFFSVPKRPPGLELRKLTLCIRKGGTRTIYLPYLQTDPNHNSMIREYLPLIDGTTFDGIQYRGEDFTV